MTTFFDLLPTDIHYTIAYHLFSSIQCDPYEYLTGRFGLEDDQDLTTLLEYAKNSRVHLRAVLCAMSSRLHIPAYWREQTILDWISVTASQLQELNLLEAPKFSFAVQPPNLPKLQKAAISMAPEHLLLIRGCSKLSDLRVVVDSTRRWDYFVSTIASLPVKSLDLVFPTVYRDGSLRSLLENLSKIDLMSFRAACPTLENFYLNPAGMRITPDAWHMIQGLQSLKTLAVRGMNLRNEGNHNPFVQRVPKLEIYNSMPIEEARRFGATVTFLEVLTPSSYEQLSELVSFPNMRKLRLVLRQGAEGALVGKIDDLDALYLSWVYENTSHPLEGFDGHPLNLVYPKYYEPDIYDLENIFTKTKKLKALRIEDVILSSDALERILAIVGHKLENLELCHDWQKEILPERMERMLKAVTRHCPKLKSLMFVEHAISSRYFIISTENQRKRCLQALQQLISALPGFKSYRIIRNIIEHRFVSLRPCDMLLWNDIILN